MPTFCTNCGREAQEGWSFCRSCGNEILPDAGKPVPPPKPPTKKVYITVFDYEPTLSLLRWNSKESSFKLKFIRVLIALDGANTPSSEAKAKTLDELYKQTGTRSHQFKQIRGIEEISKDTMQEALTRLVGLGIVQRIGQDREGDPYRYHWGPEAYLLAIIGDPMNQDEADILAESFEDLHDGTGFSKREFRKALDELIDQDIITETGRGVRGDPYKYYAGWAYREGPSIYADPKRKFIRLPDGGEIVELVPFDLSGTLKKMRGRLRTSIYNTLKWPRSFKKD